MEGTNQHSIFEIAITEESKQYLLETAKWGKLLAIVGYIISGLIIIAGIVILLAGNAFGELLGPGGGAIGTVASVVYILLGAVYFYPSLKLHRFALAVPDAFRRADQEQITYAFQNLKSVFRFWGVLTLVILGLYALVVVLGMFFGAMGGMA
jgi:hypothetical protein